MTLKEIQTLYYNTLKKRYEEEERKAIFYRVIEHYLGLQSFMVALQPNYTVTKAEINQLLEVLHRLEQGEPVQYILGHTEFYGLRYKVNNHVLIPRPETEELVSWIISDHKNNSSITLLDIGTGSGCIATSLAHNLKNSKVVALDVSEEALKVAQENANNNRQKVCFVTANILDYNTAAQKISDACNVAQFNVIVSNPPYVTKSEQKQIKKNVLAYEPHLALFVEDTNPLLFYEAIAQFAVNKLSKAGALYLEINQYLGIETQLLLEKFGFKTELRKDLAGNMRMIKATLHE